MKRTSRTNRRTASFSPVTLVLALAVFVGLGALFFFREPLAGAFWRAAAPLISLRSGLGATENARLRAQVEGLSAELADRTILHEENLYLKRLLGRNPEDAVVLAAVIMRPPGTPYDTLLLDVGNDAGLLPGNFVSAGGGALIGTLSQVYARTSRVVLFSAPGERHDALLYRGKEEVVPISVFGAGAGALYADVPAGTQAAVGDEVLIPGLRTGFSATVTAVDRGDGLSFERLHLRLPANPNQLRFVEVWRIEPAL